jgi:6-phosphogluconolactonase
MNYLDLKFESKQDFINYTGSKMLSEISAVIEKNGYINIAISGGRTPIGVFKYWASSNFSQWGKVSFFWVDERYVPLMHKDNNGYSALRVLEVLPVKAFHRIDTSLSSASLSADYYETLLNTVLPIRNGFPYFDIIQLGMGDDGHTGSLFPKTAVLEETRRVVGSVYVSKVNAYRITLTYPTILNAGKKFIFVGENREETYKNIRLNDVSYKEFPIKKIITDSQSSDEYLYF